jgi:hypothetical protein
VVLVLFSSAKAWLGINELGGRRIDDEEDFVRKEVALALGMDKYVIPLLFDDSGSLPPASKLPEDIQDLVYCKQVRIRLSHWDEDVAQLRYVLQGILDQFRANEGSNPDKAEQEKPQSTTNQPSKPDNLIQANEGSNPDKAEQEKPQSTTNQPSKPDNLISQYQISDLVAVFILLFCLLGIVRYCTPTQKNVVFKFSDVSIDNVKSQFVDISGGSFLQGNNLGNRRLTISDTRDRGSATMTRYLQTGDTCSYMSSIKPFKISSCEVTQEFWYKVMGYNPSKNNGCNNCPVENVSWNVSPRRTPLPPLRA